MKTVLLFWCLIFLSGISLFAQVSGSALQFDGNNDYINFGNSSTFNIDSAVTFEIWINPDTIQNGFILNKWVNFQEDKQMVYTGGHVTFYLHNVFAGVALVSPSIVPVHQYTHVAATYDGSTAKLYVNGVLDTSESVGSSPSNSSGMLYMGSNPDRFDFIAPFKGILDEFRIWNIARTQSEIQSTMNQSLNGNEPGLVGYWRFDEGTGPTTADLTSNGNTGNISGAVWVGGATAINNDVNNPRSFIITQNYPNPFNPATKINYTLPFESLVKAEVYNNLGEKVTDLVNNKISAGDHSIDFNAGNLPSGIYFYQFTIVSLNDGSTTRTTKKMVLLK
ncbi:MAG TPA: LamG-like jellyroll fold domain-containing protein [Ignavibacteriaceae bacterium]